MYQDFVSTTNDNCLVQMVSKPTRDNNILDLCLTNNPTLVDNVIIEPGISDHETVIAVVKLMKPRTVYIYSKADWEGMRHDMQKFLVIIPI